MKYAIAIMCVALSGCAGTMLDGKLCTIATAGQTQDLMNRVVDTHFSPEKRIQAEKYLSGAKLSATALCEVLRAREAAELQAAKGE